MQGESRLVLSCPGRARRTNMSQAMLDLSAQTRRSTGKGTANQLRRRGLLPAVVYGKDHPAQPVAVGIRDMQAILRRAHGAHLISLKVDGASYPVLLKEVQRHPVSGQLLHVDFQAVDLTQKVTAHVPVVLVGESKRQADGGVIQAGLHQVEVRCLPTELPDAIEVDVSGLKMGGSLSVGDLQVPEGVEILTPAEDVVVAVINPARATAAEQKEEEAAAPAAAEGEAATEGTEGAKSEGAKEEKAAAKA